MWFSYPNDDAWIPLELDRVKEIQQLNKKGTKPAELKVISIEAASAPVRKAPDYENVVGQDSLTRLDEANRRKKKSKNRNKNRPQQGPSASQEQSSQAVQNPRPEQGNRNNPNQRNVNRNEPNE